jgi:hypothetical protein
VIILVSVSGLLYLDVTKNIQTTQLDPALRLLVARAHHLDVTVAQGYIGGDAAHSNSNAYSLRHAQLKVAKERVEMQSCFTRWQIGPFHIEVDIAKNRPELFVAYGPDTFTLDIVKQT